MRQVATKHFSASGRLRRPAPASRHAFRATPFGTMALVWREAADGPKVERILLPTQATKDRLHAAFPESRHGRHPRIEELIETLVRFLHGDEEELSFEMMALEDCSTFQRRVLKAEYRIPRGWVSTYGGIAAHLGLPGGARAVGRALATNPFPIIIPCHRAVRSGGELGGYQGGTAMKRALLKYEGIEISATGRVVHPKLFYTPPRETG